MDKLKENGYWIAVGAIGVVLAVLIWLLVVAPLNDLASARAEVAATAEKLEAAARRKPKGFSEPAPPSKKYLEYLTDEKATATGIKTKGIEKYTEISRRFKLFFDDATEAPQPADFAARYRDSLTNLLKAYRDKFGIQVPKPGDPATDAPAPDRDQKAGPPPVVDQRDEQQAADPAVLPVIMREYWMMEAIILACQELDLGGLKSITFAGLQAAAREAAKDVSPVYSLTETTVTIDMPFSRVEDLMTRLFASDRVLFQLQACEVKREIEGVKALASLEVSKQYKDTTDARKDAYSVAEPPVTVVLQLAAFEFNGIPEVVETKDAKTEKRGKPSSRKPSKDEPQ